MKLFYSYSHKDEDLRLKLEDHLAPLRREGIVTDWHDRRIAGGDEWAGRIADELNSADIILLLVSASFIASDYCWDVEMKRALEREAAEEARVIPIVLRPCAWHGMPFGKLQALPRDGQPVTEWRDRDAALANVAEGVRWAILTRPVEGNTTITMADLLLRTSMSVQHGQRIFGDLELHRRLEIANFLHTISSSLSQAAIKLASAELSYEECESLRVHLTHLKEILSPIGNAGLLPKAELEHLYDELYAAIESPIKIVSRLEESR